MGLLSIPSFTSASSIRLSIEQAASGEKQQAMQHSSSFVGRWGQRINMPGIAFTARVMLKDRHLLMPHISVPDISWIKWDALKEHGFVGVVFDKDNTLTAPYSDSVWPSLRDSLQECKEVFEDRLVLLSNSAGLYQYDPNGILAESLEKALDMPVLRHGSKKPSGSAESLGKYFGCDPKLLVMVGDRYLTDIVYGNNNHLLTIRTAPLTWIGEPFVVTQVRKIEEALVAWWEKIGVRPMDHSLMTNKYNFIKDPGCW